MWNSVVREAWIADKRGSAGAGDLYFRRGEENMIRKISAIDGYPDLYKQTYRPSEKDKMLKTLSMIKQMAERLPLYEMHCTISEEAAVMAWERMKP